MNGFTRNSWSDSQRRRACRLVFAILVTFPAVWVALRLWNKPDPASLLAAAGQATGLNITAEGVETPRPGRVVFRGLRITPPGSAGLSIRGVDWQRGAIHEIRLDEVLQVEGQSLAGIFVIAAQALHPAGGQASATSPIRIHCQRLELMPPAAEPRGGPVFVLSPLELTIMRTATTSQCRAVFCVPGSPDGQPVELVLEREQTAGGETENWLRITTGETALPAWLLTLLLPALESAGGDAVCCVEEGTWHWVGDQRPTGSATGSYLANVDLEAVGSIVGRELAGKGSIYCDRLEWTNGRISRLQATVAAEQGRLGTGWAAFMERCGWLPKVPRAAVPFDHLQFGVEIESGRVLVLPRLENGGQIVAWKGSGTQAQVVIESNPAGRGSSLQEMAGCLFGLPASLGANQQVLGNPSIAFLDSFQLSPRAESDPPPWSAQVAAEPDERSSHR